LKSSQYASFLPITGELKFLHMDSKMQIHMQVIQGEIIIR